ncbi:MAG: hypothetical protein K2M98_06300 [Muribaculum sp.]|nr:hypothetical protein [Muribaculum sp.]
MNKIFIAAIVMAIALASPACIAQNLLKSVGTEAIGKIKMKKQKQKSSDLVSGSYNDADGEGGEDDSKQNGLSYFPSEQFEKLKNPVIRNYVTEDMSLMDMGWSLIDDKKTVQCKFDKIGNLIIETKQDDVTAIIATEIELVPGEPTLLRFDYVMANRNDKSRVGVVVNYEDDNNFDAILFDKKSFYVTNCKSGKMYIKKTAKLTFPESPVVLSFNNGKIEVMLLDKKYNNFIEVWTFKGELKKEYVGMYVSGKNRVGLTGIYAAQQLSTDEDND